MGTRAASVAAAAALAIILAAAGCGDGSGPGGGKPDGGSDEYAVTYEGNDSTSGSVPVDSSSYREGDTVRVKGNEGGLAKDGFTFVGWNASPGGAGTDYAEGSDLKMGPSDLTLWAKWTSEPTYAVAYLDNESTGGSPPIDAGRYLAGQKAVVLGNPGGLFKTGYSFNGWCVTPVGTGPTYAPGVLMKMIAHDATLYALWTDQPTHAVTYDGNGADKGSTPIDDMNYRVGQTIVVRGNDGALTKDGCCFSGWNTRADDGGDEYAAGNELAMGSEDLVLYARWTREPENYWTGKAPLRYPRGELAAAVVGGKIYAIGGQNIQGVETLGVVEAYDPASNSWMDRKPMPTARFGLAAVELGGKIYAIGGNTGGLYLNTVEVYDPATNAWSTGPGMIHSRYSLSAAVVDGKIYAIGGAGESNTTDLTMERYDPATGAWEARADMPTERFHFSAAAVGTKICVAGGCINAANNTTAASYDPVADSWTEIPAPAWRQDAPAVALGGLMIVIGGYTSGTHGFVQACKPGFAWKPRANLPTGRAASAAAVLDGRIFVIGGWSGAMAVDYVDLGTVEEYWP
jgi:uncharacterized repeat protein (TIGR02543 family)